MTYSVEIPNMALLQQLATVDAELTTREVAKAVNQSLYVLQGSAKDKAPVDEGILQGSLLVSPAQINGNTVEGSMGTQVKYAGYQEGGTGIFGPHQTPIVPTTKKALSFMMGGNKVTVRSVKGVKARKYMEGAIEDNQGRIDSFFQAAASRIAARLGGAQ